MELSDKQKDLLFKVFLFGIIEAICFFVYITISGLSGNFNWTVEQLTSTPVGMILQIVNLIIVVDGIVMFLYLLAFVITLITG